MAPPKAALVQLSLLVVIAFMIFTTVQTDAIPHHPVYTDASPHHPVHRPPQQQMDIRGVVFCKPCNQKGINSLKGAKPLFKAVVKLHCNNTVKEQGLVETTQTDKKGHFVFTPKINVKQPKKMHQVIHNKCKVFLVSSPSNKNVDDCSVPTNLHGGVSGAVVVPHHRRPRGHVTNSFNVRPLAFEPPKFCYTA